MNLPAIVKYKMNELEATSYKCALIWEKVCKSLFPREKCSRLRQTGDPRKSYLFKCCYTLVNNRRHIIGNDEFKLYIFAQLDMLRKISDGTQHARIDPVCLFGGKSWQRWDIWKKNYNKQRNFKTKTIAPSEERVVQDLNRTKRYLLDVFGKDPTSTDIQNAYSSRAMLRWFRLGKISPYFLILFPPIYELNGWGVDLNLYREHINGNEDNLKAVFNYS